MQRDIRIERLLAHAPGDVWRAVSDASLLGAWLMPNDLDPVVGRAFTFRMAPQRGWDGITYCEVLELDPERTIAFRYRGRASAEKTLACAGLDPAIGGRAAPSVFTQLDTVLRFRVAPEPACDGTRRTRFVLEHTGFRGLQLVLVSFVMGHGWKKLVDRRLPPVLATLPVR